MRYVYRGTEPTYHPQLGRLDPHVEGEGPDEIVALCIAGGLLEAVEDASGDMLCDWIGCAGFSTHRQADRWLCGRHYQDFIAGQKESGP